MPGAGRPLRVLLIEDSEDDAAIVLRALRRGGFAPEARRVDDEAGVVTALAEPWDVVLCDHGLPGYSALAALARVRQRADLPFILVSGTIGEEAAVEAMRAGVDDFVLKDRLGRLVPAIERGLRDAANRAELRRAEEMLRRSETLRTLGQMAIGIAHDLKNVLNPLGLHVALVERACDRAGVARPESLAKMREIIHHGVETIDRLRAFSRVEREAVADRFDLAAAAREALALAATRRDGRAELALVDETTEVGTVPGSRGDVVDAVLNLLVNAQEACAGGGRIVVTTGADAQAAWVAVADNGPGMAPEVRARAFDPFFTTKGEQGTGLGLANVYATARRHGGEVDLDTAPGAGARFTVRLPR